MIPVRTMALVIRGARCDTFDRIEKLPVMEVHITCEKCWKLLELYKSALMAYEKASSQLSGIIGDDFKRAFEQCERLRHACQAANAEALAHINSTHEHSQKLAD